MLQKCDRLLLGFKKREPTKNIQKRESTKKHTKIN